MHYYRHDLLLDPIWQAYWNGPGHHRDGPVVRTVHECLQAVLWNGTVGLTPLAHARPEGSPQFRWSTYRPAASSWPGRAPTVSMCAGQIG
jgi:hypothetical protein